IHTTVLDPSSCTTSLFQVGLLHSSFMHGGRSTFHFTFAGAVAGTGFDKYSWPPDGTCRGGSQRTPAPTHRGSPTESSSPEQAPSAHAQASHKKHLDIFIASSTSKRLDAMGVTSSISSCRIAQQTRAA